MRQDPRGIFSVLLAGCLAVDASDGLVANGEDSPGRGLVAPLQVRLAQPGALDWSLRIELPPLNPQQSAVTSAPRRPAPVRVGFHRQLTEYQGDLVPRLQWVDDPHDGSVAAFVAGTAPGASRVRLAIRATLPPGGAIHFFHGAPPEVVGGDGSGLLVVRGAASAVVAIGSRQHHWSGTHRTLERCSRRNRPGNRPRSAPFRTVACRLRRSRPGSAASIRRRASPGARVGGGRGGGLSARSPRMYGSVAVAACRGCRRPHRIRTAGRQLSVLRDLVERCRREQLHPLFPDRQPLHLHAIRGRQPGGVLVLPA